MCKINRISIYLLLSILINLCGLTFQIAHAIKVGTGHTNMSGVNVLTTIVPIFLAGLGYALEVDIGEGENSSLNTARHAFSCSMRYA